MSSKDVLSPLETCKVNLNYSSSPALTMCLLSSALLYLFVLHKLLYSQSYFFSPLSLLGNFLLILIHFVCKAHSILLSCSSFSCSSHLHIVISYPSLFFCDPNTFLLAVCLISLKCPCNILI